jgi:3-oxoacyl-[acyl-carrier protein] reductase
MSYATQRRIGLGELLKGQTAIVTGASAGLGRAIAIALAKQGANLMLTARRSEKLRSLRSDIEALGTNAIWFAGDAGDEESAKRATELAIERFGRIDILINNAGSGSYKDLIETSAEDFDQLMRANVRSGFLFSRYAVPHLISQKRGVLFFISSVAGLTGARGESVYCATKFAQVGFAQALDAELRKHGIKVGVLCPGGMKTEFAVGKGRTLESMASSRMMDAEEVADIVAFACMLPENVRIPQMTIRHMA